MVQARMHVARIACLAWGSLVWDTGEHPLPLRTKWKNDGPELPIEFARISDSRNGALTLVLFPKVAPSKTLWAEMELKTISEAIGVLSHREQTSVRNIGFWQKTGEFKSPVIPTLPSDISKWASDRNLEGVIWTALSSNFIERLKKPLTPENAIEYLRSLTGSKGFPKAEEYFRKAPMQIETEVRRVVRGKLGWA